VAILVKLFESSETVALSTATGYSVFPPLDRSTGLSYQVVQTGAGSSVVTLQFSNDGSNWDDVDDSALTLTTTDTCFVEYDSPHAKNARIKIVATGVVSCVVTKQRRGA
jgi:hypothetical protein